MIAMTPYSLAFLSLLASVKALTINTPGSLVQCQPVSISFLGGQPPYYISVIPGNEPSATPLEQFPLQALETGTYTWIVDIPAGTSVGLAITDQTGTTAYDAAQVIMPSSSNDNTCLGLSNPVAGSTPASSGDGSDTGTTTTRSPKGTKSTSSSSHKASHTTTAGTRDATTAVVAPTVIVATQASVQAVTPIARSSASSAAPSPSTAAVVASGAGRTPIVSFKSLGSVVVLGMSCILV